MIAARSHAGRIAAKPALLPAAGRRLAAEADAGRRMAMAGARQTSGIACRAKEPQ